MDMNFNKSIAFTCNDCGTKAEKKELGEGKNRFVRFFLKCDCVKKLLAEQEKEREEYEKKRERILKYKKLKNIYISSGFVRRYRNQRIKKLSCEFIKESNVFVENFKPRSKGMFFIGKTGNGKTTLATCIGKELILRGNSVLIMNFAEYLNKLQQTYNNRYNDESSFDELLDRWTLKTDLLIIDDFGREKYTDKRLENAFLFFDKLYNNCTSFIITANPENIARIKNIPEFFALFDRLAESLYKYQFNNNSFRRN